MAKKVPIWVLIYGDGAVYGADRNPAASERRYWLGFTLEDDHGPFQIVEAHVPEALAKKLEAQGTAEGFDDGYKALDAINKADRGFGTREPEYSEGEMEW